MTEQTNTEQTNTEETSGKVESNTITPNVENDSGEAPAQPETVDMDSWDSPFNDKGSRMIGVDPYFQTAPSQSAPSPAPASPPAIPKLP